MYMADETGGQSIVNTNAFEKGLDRIAVDFEHFYSLGFAPPHAGNGRTYRLEVKLKDKIRGAKIRHRGSYRDKSLELEMEEATLATLGSRWPPMTSSLATSWGLLAMRRTLDSGPHVSLPRCRWCQKSSDPTMSRSAATAAAMAIDGNLAVQDVPYDKLRERLLADGQILHYGKKK